jgi:signal transduction histidine kinase
LEFKGLGTIIARMILKPYLGIRFWKKAIEKQIKFPQQNLAGYIFRYGSAALISAAITLLIFLFKTDSYAIPLLAFLLGTLVATGLGGAAAGGVLIISGVIVTSLLFYNSITSTYLIGIAIYTCVGVLFGSIIDWTKKIHLIREFNRREGIYLATISKLKAQNVRASREIRIRDEFLSIASHELKTPLTSTLLKLQIALNNIKNVSLADFSVQKLLEMLESAEQQTQRLSKMINDLLNISIIRTGRLDLEKEESDLSEIVREAVGGFSEKAERDGYKINLEASGKIKAVVDRVRVNQVVTNLVSNAIKYGVGNPIDVKVEKRDSVGKIIVEDHGIGIPSSDQNKIFSLFERAHDNTYSGLGIGLYISNQIVKAHKGKIKVDSKPGHGSTFIVELPLHKSSR